MFPFPDIVAEEKRQEVQRKKPGLKAPVSSLLGLQSEFPKGVD